MTKADIIAQIANRTEADRLDVQQIIEAFFSVVKDNMAEGENIYVRGFGSFVNTKRARKVARNISKQEPMIIEPHYIPDFKPAKVFSDAVKKSEVLLKRLEEDEASEAKKGKSKKKSAATA